MCFVRYERYSQCESCEWTEYCTTSAYVIWNRMYTHRLIQKDHCFTHALSEHCCVPQRVREDDWMDKNRRNVIARIFRCSKSLFTCTSGSSKSKLFLTFSVRTGRDWNQIKVHIKKVSHIVNINISFVHLRFFFCTDCPMTQMPNCDDFFVWWVKQNVTFNCYPKAKHLRIEFKCYCFTHDPLAIVVCHKKLDDSICIQNFKMSLHEAWIALSNWKGKMP